MMHSKPAARSYGFALAIMSVVAMALGWPQAAQAGHGTPSGDCPTVNLTVTRGGSVQIDDACDTGFGIGFNLFHQATHGTAVIVEAGSSVQPSIIRYDHNGSDPATTDSFVYDDGAGFEVLVNLTIEDVTGPLPLNIDPNDLPTIFAGKPYSQQLSASGGSGSITYALKSGTLPIGITLSAGGLISGTTTSRFDVIFTIEATDSTGLTGEITYSEDVEGDTLTLSPNPPPDGFLNYPYSVTFTTGGGVAPRTVVLASGSLPPGLSLGGSNGHTLSGTPTALGSYTFQLNVEDSSDGFGTHFTAHTVSLDVLPQPTITVAPATLADGAVGAAYSQTVSGSGGSAPYTFAVSAGSLPAGLNLNANTGAISGTPSAGGASAFTIMATDANGFSGQRAYAPNFAAPNIVIAPATLPNAAAGQSYGPQAISASGGTAPYTYALVSGALPAGLSLASDGTLSGTPTATGSFNFSVRATDSSTGAGPYTADQPYALTVTAPTIVLGPASLPDGTNGAAYSQTLTVSGGVAPYAFAVSAGSLPTGLSLNAATGQISGTPSEANSFSFDVAVTDSTGGSGPYTDTVSYTVVIASSVPVANDSSATVGYSSAATNIPLDITGGTPTSVAVVTAPAHGAASVSGASISYQPAAGYAGPDSFSYTASNADGASAPATVSITVSDPVITVTASASLTAQVGVAYSQTFTWSGGAAPYSGYAVTGLPAGLAVSASDTDSVTVSGTPTQAGNFTVNASATDASTGNGPFTTAEDFSLLVNAPTLSMTPDPGPALLAPYGQSYSQTFTASGGTAPYTYTLNGALPTGLSFDSSTGILSGTPTQTGFFQPLEIKATDSSTGPTGPFEIAYIYRLQVSSDFDWSALPNAVAGVAYDQQLSTVGGVAPYTYSMNIGTSLPPGLSLAANGRITGIPTTSGSFNFNIQATDSNGVTGARGYNFTVAVPTLTVTPASLPDATAGFAYSQAIDVSGGNVPYSYAITAGALPPGIALDTSGATATLTGTPTASGSYSFDLQVTDSTGGTAAVATMSYTLQVQARTIALTPTSLPGGTVGQAYSRTFSATGGIAPYQYTVAAGALPDGLTLDAGTGVLSGTPTTAGAFNFDVQATDSGGTPVSITVGYSVAIADAVPVAANDAATTAAGQPVTIAVTGNDSGVIDAIAIVTAAQHGSVTVTGLDALYTPDAGYAGSDSFTYTASGPGGVSAPATVSLTVSDPVITVTASAPLTAQVGVAYSQTFTWSGGTAPYSGYAVTGLPAGLAVTASDTDSVTVSGTPTQAGNFTVTASATDASTGNGPFTTARDFSLQVDAPGLSMTPAAGALNVDYAQSYSQSFTASGGTAPFSYALTGTLPAGLSFNAASGTLSGTPTQTGSFAVTVTATDSSTGPAAPYSLGQAYTLAVAAPSIAITPAALVDGTVGITYAQDLAASSGVAPYAFTLASGSLPNGLTLGADGQLAGTPTASGTFAFTVLATDANGQTGARGYNLTIAVATLSLQPGNLPDGKVGQVYNQSLSTNGGIAPYSYAVAAGSLPDGLNLDAASGALSGTPTTAGSFAFDVQVTDSGVTPVSTTVGYSVAIAEAAPVAADDAAETVAEQAVTIAVTGNDSGVIDAIAIVTAPQHGSVKVTGVEAIYTPTAGFSGSDSFTYTANGPGGSSAAATVTVEVAALPVPVGQPQQLSTLAGEAVSFDAATGASGGPFTGVAVVERPAEGEVVVDGTRITYTPPLTASGTARIGYTLSNAYGASTPITSTIMVNPVPVATAHRAQVLAGASVAVELTGNATGGPFTGAQLLSIEPANAGTASVARIGDGDEAGYRLDFTAAVDYAGTATLRYTLSNAHATSAPATVTIEVTARPDPTLDPEVTGLLRAQTQSTRRLARGQIGNFQQRLEALHDQRSAGFDNGLSVAIERPCAELDWQMPGSACPRPLDDEQAAVRAPAASTTTAGTAPLFAIWTGGAMRFGEYDPQRGASGFEFETRGVSLGADYRIGPAFALGGGFGYGRDVSDIGDHGSRSEADAWTAALYASYHPGEHVYLDGLLGHQWLSFDLRRHVTANQAQVRGQRDGRQWFASLAAGYQWQREQLGLAPYLRVDAARATLDGYTETGDPLHALMYADQEVDTTTTSLGLRADYLYELDWGTFTPQLRLEYQHDLDADSVAEMRYADLPTGPFYRTAVDGFDRNRFVIGLGAGWHTDRDLGLRLEYLRLLGNDGRRDQTLRLQIEKRF